MMFNFVPDTDGLREAATALFAIYSSMVEAGFREDQALQVVIAIALNTGKE